MGLLIKELCRKHRFSEASYFGWKANFCGMTASKAQKFKALGAEDPKL